MTRRVVDDVAEEPDYASMSAEEFSREIALRAELITARLHLDRWERRVRELEVQLPEGNPLRRA